MKYYIVSYGFHVDTYNSISSRAEDRTLGYPENPTWLSQKWELTVHKGDVKLCPESEPEDTWKLFVLTSLCAAQRNPGLLSSGLPLLLG